MLLTWYRNKQKILDDHKTYWYIIFKKFSELKNLGMMLCMINTFLNQSKSYIALGIKQYRPLWIRKSEIGNFTMLVYL